MEFLTWPTAPEVASRVVGFVRGSVQLAGYELLHLSDPGSSPFLISYEAPLTGRTGAVCYASPLMASHRSKAAGLILEFEVRSGPSDSAQSEFWKDPFDLFTTVVVGIDLTMGLFVGVDPGMQDPVLLPRRVPVAGSVIQKILSRGWYAWEDEVSGFHETIIGASQCWFTEYVRFESLATRLDPGHRQLLSEKFFEDRVGRRRSG